jgi:prophage regulatory protein
MTQEHRPFPDDALLRLEEVLKRIPVSRSTFYAGQAQGIYPTPISVGRRARAYRYADIKAWLADPEAWRLANSNRGSK